MSWRLKLNVKHHRTTPKPEIYTSITAKTKLRWTENSLEHQTYTGGAAAAAEVRIYAYACIQARPISKNPGSMEEECQCGVPRLTCFTTPSRGGRGRRAAVDVFRGVFVSVWWRFVCLFSISLLRTHTACCTYEATLPHVPLY